MITFKDYLDEARELDDSGMPKNMTPQRAIAILNRTRQSIKADVQRGGHTGRTSSQRLMDRYSDHKDWLKDHHPDHWKQYCNSHGSVHDHDAGDLYA